RIDAGTSNDHWTSCDGNLVLKMGTGGSLALWAGNRLLWYSHTGGSGSNNYAIMRTDGFLAVHNSSGTELWKVGASGYTNTYLDVRDDGNLVLYDTPTNGKVREAATGLQTIVTGNRITGGTSSNQCASFDGRFTLKMDTTGDTYPGDLVLRQG